MEPRTEDLWLERWADQPLALGGVSDFDPGAQIILLVCKNTAGRIITKTAFYECGLQFFNKNADVTEKGQKVEIVSA